MRTVVIALALFMTASIGEARAEQHSGALHSRIELSGGIQQPSVFYRLFNDPDSPSTNWKGPAFHATGGISFWNRAETRGGVASITYIRDEYQFGERDSYDGIHFTYEAIFPAIGGIIAVDGKPSRWYIGARAGYFWAQHSLRGVGLIPSLSGSTVGVDLFGRMVFHRVSSFAIGLDGGYLIARAKLRGTYNGDEYETDEKYNFSGPRVAMFISFAGGNP